MGFAAIAGTIAAAAAVGGSVYQGVEQQRLGKAALRLQEQTQRKAESRAAAALRREELEARRLNRKQPNIPSLLSAERELERRGTASLLTGPTGVTKNTLGAPSKLGGL